MSYNYYKILGVSEKAGVPEIKRAFRDLAKRYHPDRNRDVSSSEFFIVLNEAYHVLVDPARRQAHDEYLGLADVSISTVRTAYTPGEKRAERRSRRHSEFSRNIHTPPQIWNPPVWVKQLFYIVGVLFGSSVSFFTFLFVSNGSWPFFMSWVSILGIIVLLDSVSGIVLGNTLMSSRLGNKIKSWFIS